MSNAKTITSTESAINLKELFINNNFIINYPLIDLQHIWLCYLMYQLESFIKSDSERKDEEINKTIVEIINFSNEHFGLEEELFAFINYSNTETHSSQHNGFLNEIRLIVNDKKTGKAFIERLNQFLTYWLYGHILISDKHYLKFIQMNHIDVEPFFSDILNDKTTITIKQEQIDLYKFITGYDINIDIKNYQLEIKLIKYFQKYSMFVNIPIIDLHHLWLGKIILDLEEDSKNVDDSEKLKVFNRAMMELSDYSIYHFTFEEMIMKDLSYEDFIIHKNLHKIFIENIQNRDITQKDQIQSAIFSVTNYLKTWLSSHVAVHDRKMSLFLYSNKAALLKNIKNYKKSGINLFNSKQVNFYKKINRMNRSLTAKA